MFMIKKLIKYRYLSLVFVIILTAISLWFIPSLFFKTDFSQFLPENDPAYIFYKAINNELENDENILVIGIEEEDIFNYDILKKVTIFIDSVSKLSGVRRIKGLTNLTYPVKTLFGVVQMHYLNLSDSANITSYRKKVFEDFELTQHFVNDKGTIMYLWITTKKGLSTEESTLFLETLNRMRKESLLNTYLIGQKYLEFSFKKILSKEIVSFVLWFFLFLVIALKVIYKNVIALLFPITLVFVSLLIFLGGMAFLHRPLGIMANLFPVVILIVGISDVIHMTFKYDKERLEGATAKNATYITIKEIGWTTFITSFTTAIGFFVLFISPMEALRNFGLEAGFAVMLAFFLTLFLASSFFSESKKVTQFSKNNYFNQYSRIIFEKIKFLLNYPKSIIGFFVVLLIVSIFGILEINTNNLRLSNIPNNSELHRNYTFFEKNAGGSRNFELILKAKDGHYLNEPELLKSIFETHQYLDSLPYLTAVKSPIIYYSYLNKIYSPKSKKKLSIPENKKDILKYTSMLASINTSNYLFNKDHTIYKISTRMKDFGREVVAEKNKEILLNVERFIDTSKIEVSISGMDYLIDRAHQERINNMLYGLLIAIIIVAITLGFIYRNWMLIILTLLLNFIPIFITAGIMGFTNIELRGATSIIFTVGFVIAIDDTIHLLSKFQWERKKGRTIEQSIFVALRECGAAIIATSVVLIGGFAVLMLSDFMEIYTLGLFVAITVFITLIVDLILAPILILNWFKKYV